MMVTTEDRFLGGRIVCAQPKHGFRAGHDTVLLAAAVPARSGERVLELGSGAGVSSLCLAARVDGADITGVELDVGLVALANANAARNGFGDRVRFIEGDVLDFPSPSEGEEDRLFDHVFFNPPFHPSSGDISPSVARDRAMRGDDIALWMAKAVEMCASGGTVTAIVRADRIGELETNAPGLTVLPLAPHEGEAARRAIVQWRKGGIARTLAPFVLHRANGTPTPEAEAVLRHAGALTL